MKGELTAAAIRQAKANKHKLKRRVIYAGVGLFLFAILMWYLFSPFKGDMRFGVCRTFLELKVSMPTTLRITGIDDKRQSMRLWFTSTNPFGQYRLASITCDFKPNQSAPEGFDLKAVEINGEEVDKKEIESFNKSIIAVYAGKPDLNIPAPLPDALDEMQIDPTRYYRVLF